MFLYREVLKKELGDFGEITWAKRPEKMPVVFTREETKQVLLQLTGVNWLLGQLLYGSGLRIMECIRLRVKDIDFGYRQVLVRNGKGGINKDERPTSNVQRPTLNDHYDLYSCSQSGRQGSAKPGGFSFSELMTL